MVVFYFKIWKNFLLIIIISSSSSSIIIIIIIIVCFSSSNTFLYNDLIYLQRGLFFKPMFLVIFFPSNNFFKYLHLYSKFRCISFIVVFNKNSN